MEAGARHEADGRFSARHDAATALPGPLFRLAADCALLKVDGRSLLFSQTGQQLFELNESAALLAQNLSNHDDPQSSSDMCSQLERSGFAAEEAADAVRSVLCAWSQAGVAQFDFPPRTAFPQVRHTALGPQRIDLRFADCALADLVYPSFAHLAATAPDTVECWRVAAHEGLVLVDRPTGKPVVLEPRQAVPAIKAWLLEDLLQTSTDFTALHGACLVRNGKALLLLGPPGAGKSTLAARLLQEGFGFGGDDLCFLGHDGQVRGVPFPLTAKPGAWPLLEPFRPDLPSHPVHLRLDGKWVRFLPPPGPVCDQAVPIGWTVWLAREGEAEARLTPRHRADALCDLLGEAFSRHNHTNLADLLMVLEALGDASSHVLSYSTLDDAASVLARLCGDD